MAGILANLLGLPFAPVRVVISVARVLQRQAEQELYGSVNVRRQLEELDEAARSGAISEAERDQAQRTIVDRLGKPPRSHP